MKKYYFFLLFLLFSNLFSAQTWCPPGAMWTYKFDDNLIGEHGYTQVKLTGTVSVNGITCKALNIRRYGSKYYGTMPFDDNLGSLNTYESNGVIFYQTGPQRFDTIANFNANIGDGWYVAGWTNSCDFPQTKIVVYDTGHVTINGEYLKRLRIDSTSAGAQYGLYIVEKIGPTFNSFLYQSNCCHIDCWNEMGNFRCYKDDNFGLYSKPGYSDCNFVSVKENSSDLKNIKLFPNPNKGQFTIETNVPVRVLILDQLGSLIYEMNIENAGEHTFAVPELSPGVYILKADNESGSANFKFLKE
jgi:hypothetical protein